VGAVRTPEFWYPRNGGVLAGLLPGLLAPAAAVYRRVAMRRREAVRPWRAPIPVVCVGNVVAGGTGKTPVALSIGDRLARRGLEAHFLSRGYGGALAGPVRVDPERHTAAEVGDEPLLLAQVRPTWVARDRREGVLAAAGAGADVVVMDDGFQNPSVVKDLAIVVVDAPRGFGNGRMIPAGPLREPLAAGLARADAVALIGPDTGGIAERIAPRPILRACLKPDAPVARRLAGHTVVAFAGIGHPQKFFATLREMGCTIVAAHAFADHHVYRAREIAAIVRQAEAARAIPVTTAKDFIRLQAAERVGIAVIPVGVAWDDEAALDRVLDPVLNRADHAR
jgi:tetraacyldisaccharide 4'-kinase